MSHAGPAILIVDDDPDIAISVSDVLTDMGYQTDIAGDGQSALDLVRNRSYDVALLDFKMPEMDGVALYQQIQKLRPTIVAIMVTAYAGSDGVNRARNAGTWKVLRKPVDLDTLLGLIEEAVGSR